MSYYLEYKELKKVNFDKFWSEVTVDDVEEVVRKSNLNRRDFLTLLAPEAAKKLEVMAQKANQLTTSHFGKTIKLYLPLYLSNYCENQCLYCGFKAGNDVKRQKLTLEEVRKEAKAIAAKGIQHLLILTGGSRKKTPISYLRDCVLVLKEYFSSVALEVYPLEEEEYAKLIEAGVEGLTIYQEVYNQKRYKKLHPRGPKSDYRYRLKAPERACKAGMRWVNIGSLFGLDDWRKEAFFAGIHARYLQKKYLGTKLNLSLPRFNVSSSTNISITKVSDRNLVQIALAFRLFLPRVGLNLSTRESAKLRDNLIPLGITKMSAESSTAVGGYASKRNDKQFATEDNRSVEEIKAILRKKGYQPVLKDWPEGHLV